MDPNQIYHLENVFVTEGVPAYTFVTPPNYGDIYIDIRKPGKPVIIEGQSGTGKTTTVKAILQELSPSQKITYLTARRPVDVESAEEIALNRPAGYFVIDDFHRLSLELRTHLAEIAKLAAEQGSDAELPKLILIGINEVGSDLIQLVGDIGKRTGIHKIVPGGPSEITKLVAAGCEKLNITFDDPMKIFDDSRGDYWLTQQICQSLCSMNDVMETTTESQTIPIDLNAVRARVINKLEASYYPVVKDFCRGRRFRPGNDPYFKLLREIGKQDRSIVDLTELANAVPEVRGSINNIKDRRLRILLESKPKLSQHFYYNDESRNFAIEDPALFYFVRHLDWPRLRSDCGFRQQERSREFDVAISFAGENRELAAHVAAELEFLDVHVFFDRLYEDNYLGKAWGEQFKRVFLEESDLIVCLLDRHHSEKIWPTFERDCFVPRRQDGDVIPIFLDETIFVGIPRDTIGIHFKWTPTDPDWKTEATEKIVMRLIDRLSI